MNEGVVEVCGGGRRMGDRLNEGVGDVVVGGWGERQAEHALNGNGGAVMEEDGGVGRYAHRETHDGGWWRDVVERGWGDVVVGGWGDRSVHTNRQTPPPHPHRPYLEQPPQSREDGGGAARGGLIALLLLLLLRRPVVVGGGSEGRAVDGGGVFRVFKGCGGLVCVSL